jgi:serine protease Do
MSIFVPKTNRAFSRIAARWAIFAAPCAIAATLAACSGSSGTAPSKSQSSQEVRTKVHVTNALHAAEGASIADIVEGVLPSVVSVTTTRNARPQSPMELFFGGPGAGRAQQGLGSGVIVSASGLVVTNNHVIDGADEVRVQTHDEREFTAKVVGADKKSDVAVLQLQDATGLVPIVVGDSSALRLGDVVLAVGYPFGVGQTVTMGIVSATGRSDMGIVDYENFIQTDAAINPGNSGGALINVAGELVGINTAILSRSGGSMGIGFAIPTNMAGPIVAQLEKNGKVSRGWLGVQIQDLDADLKTALEMGGADGVLIADVEENSPAEKGGVRSGDVVTHINGERIGSTGQFRNLIGAAGAEAKVVLAVYRDKKSLKLDVDLGALSDEDVGPSSGSKGQEKGSDIEGLSLETLDDRLRTHLKVPGSLEGVVITRVAPDSRAARAKLRPGDIILQINKQPARDTKEAKKLFAASKGPQLLQILRQGHRLWVVVK